MTANSAIFEPRWPLGPARSARKDRRGVLRLAGDCQKREAGADFRSGRSPSGECRIRTFRRPARTTLAAAQLAFATLLALAANGARLREPAWALLLALNARACFHIRDGVP